MGSNTTFYPQILLPGEEGRLTQTLERWGLKGWCVAWRGEEWVKNVAKRVSCD
jgi:hypothetical protein